MTPNMYRQQAQNQRMMADQNMHYPPQGPIMDQSRSSYPMGVGGPPAHTMMETNHLAGVHTSPMLGGLAPQGPPQKEQHPYNMGPA